MKKLRLYAYFLQLFCLLLVLPLIIVAFFYKWLQPVMPVYSDIADGAKQVRLYIGLLYAYTPSCYWLPSPVLVRILGALIDGVSVVLFCWGCIYFVQLLHYYKRNELFSLRTLSIFHSLSRIVFFWALYNPVKLTLLSIVTTFFSPTGQRIIVFGITSIYLVFNTFSDFPVTSIRFLVFAICCPAEMV